MQSNTAGSVHLEGASKAHIGNTYSTTNNYYTETNRPDQEDQSRFLAALQSTDPREDKVRIEQTRGGLLKDSYHWILQNPQFLSWRDLDEHRLLWIRGDPGKGKTMLLCGIIDELSPRTKLKDPDSEISLSYFFCQATNSGLNNATSVLRGLAYLLAVQNPSLLSHLRDKQHVAQDTRHWNSRVAMEDALSKMLADPTLQDTYLVVDALDECQMDLDFLLGFIISSLSSKVKWVISSRNRAEIQEYLEEAEEKLSLPLELNQDSISQAVDIYIQHRVGQLTVKKRFKDNTAQLVRDYLSQNAHGTFLWVALVCQQLEKTRSWEIKKQLLLFPAGLYEFYKTMMEQIESSNSSDLFIKILAIASTVYRPIALEELRFLEELPEDEDEVFDIIKECGSFLTVREGIMYFVHQSAKEFLLEGSKTLLFPFGLAEHHHDIFEKCLQAMDVLKEDIYGLTHPGVTVDQALDHRPNPDPLSGRVYSCVFWVEHLYHAHTICKEDSLSQYDYQILDNANALSFITTKFLFWLEALSLSRNLSATITSLNRIKELLSASFNANTELFGTNFALVEDARRFFLYFRPVIEEYPLQIYTSGLIFSPEKSVIRNLFNKHSPKFVEEKPPVESSWSSCLHIFERDNISNIFFPTNQSLAVITDSPSGIVIWDIENGATQTIKRIGGEFSHIIISSDCKWLAGVNKHDSHGRYISGDVSFGESSTNSSSEDSISDSNSEDSITYIEKDLIPEDYDSEDSICRYSISDDSNLGNWRAMEDESDYNHPDNSISRSQRDNGHDSLEIWDLDSKAIQWTANMNGREVLYLEVSPDSQSLAVCFARELEFWDVEKRVVQKWPLKMRFEGDIRLSFSSDGILIVIRQELPELVQALALNVHTGEQYVSPRHRDTKVDCAKFLPNTHQILLTSITGHSKNPVWLWDLDNKSCHLWLTMQHRCDQIAFSSDGSWMVAGFINALWLYDMRDKKLLQKFQTPSGHGCWEISVSSDNLRLAACNQNEVSVWDVPAIFAQPPFRDLPTFENLFLSADGSLAAVVSFEKIQVWNVHTGQLSSSFPFPGQFAISMAFSSDCHLLASVKGLSKIRIYDLLKNELCYKLKAPGHINDVVVSHDGNPECQWVAALMRDSICFWNVNTGMLHRELKLPSEKGKGRNMAASPGLIAVRMERKGRNEVLFYDTVTNSTRFIPIESQDYSLWTALALSPNGKWLAHARRNTRKILLIEVETGILRASLDISTIHISFPNDSFILTDQGMINLDDVFRSQPTTKDRDDSQTASKYINHPTDAKTIGYGYSKDSAWINLDGSRLIWLPPQYRPSDHGLGTVMGKQLMIVNHQSGNAFFIKMSKDTKSLLSGKIW